VAAQAVSRKRSGAEMTDQSSQEETSDPILQEIAAITTAVDALSAKIAPYMSGMPDFTGVRLEVLIKLLVQIGLVTEEQYNLMNLTYAREAHQQLVAIAAEVDQHLRAQRMTQLAQRVGPIDLSNLKRPQGR
jgi:hypothetical protein